MALNLKISVQAQDFDTAAEIASASQDQGDIGAVVTFSGLCRDEAGTLAALELEHYPGMAERQLERLAQKAAERWPLDALTIIHRFGRIEPGQSIVLVVTASAHRQAAFAAADFLMDYLKSNAPFWKREITKDGQVRGWVEAKAEDDAALDRWN